MTDISKFLLLDRLAVGGMAEVYRAKSLGVHGFEKIIAIKRILPALAEDEEFVQMFVEEAKIAGRLRHANITRIFELGKVQGTHFIAMEYVFGKDLLQIRKRLEASGRRMSPAMASWIIAAVLGGLDYAHRQRGPDGQPLGIIHRDISPQNVLISYDGLVKLCDFGIAKAASRATQTVAGVVKGKLGYMSPEQISGRPIDHRSDVFAASTVLWELLTGERLFGKGTDFEVLERVRDAKADPPSTLAPEVTQVLDAVVMRGLARDPDDRWETAGDMHEALMAVLMSYQPPFSTARLAEWMHQEYAEVIGAELAHLEKLGQVEEEGVDVRSSVPEELPQDEWEDQTVLSDPPELYDEPEEVSIVVQIEDVVGLSSPDEPDDPEPPPPLPRIGRTSVEHSEMIALSSAVAAARGRASPAPSAAPVTASASAAAPASASAPVSASASAPAVREAPRSSIEPPRSVSAPELGTAPPPARKKGGVRWGLLLLVAVFAALVGMGGVALYLYLNGHPLPFPS